MSLFHCQEARCPWGSGGLMTPTFNIPSISEFELVFCKVLCLLPFVLADDFFKVHFVVLTDGLWEIWGMVFTPFNFVMSMVIWFDLIVFSPNFNVFCIYDQWRLLAFSGWYSHFQSTVNKWLAFILKVALEMGLFIWAGWMWEALVVVCMHGCGLLQGHKSACLWLWFRRLFCCCRMSSDQADVFCVHWLFVFCVIHMSSPNVAEDGAGCKCWCPIPEFHIYREGHSHSWLVVYQYFLFSPSDIYVFCSGLEFF